MAYTNSPLVDYTNLSPNHSGLRTHSIDRITPHCVVGQLSAESICGCFTSTSRQASCNYGIGKDGRVSLCVEEKNRSWCSSSAANDQRAITIECASDLTHPYAMNSAVYTSLIELCTDICKRNGKAKLLWLGDKNKTLNYAPAADEMVLTVHRWYANKACPGDWLYSRLGDLAAKVTAALGTITGMVSGYRGGVLDTLLMRLSDLCLAFPGLLFAMAIAAMLGGGLKNAALALLLTGWPKYARLARSQTLALKDAPFLDACALAGASTTRLLFSHILPNIAPTLLVTAALDIGTTMMELAGLSFLGLGAAPPTAELGSMMSDGRSMLQTSPWVILAPGLAIFIVVSCFNLLGDALRDVLDPRSTSRRFGKDLAP